MIQVVNIVASGSLGIELDLKVLSQELDEIADYDPEKDSGAYVRFEGHPLITIYRTGKYIITGASTESGLSLARKALLNELQNHEILSSSEDNGFAIQNYVCVGNVQQQLDLNGLAIGLGLEVTEYEPEQFPALVYRAPNQDCVILIFGSGRVVITGAKDIESAEQAFTSLCERIDEPL